MDESSLTSTLLGRRGEKSKGKTRVEKRRERKKKKRQENG